MKSYRPTSPGIRQRTTTDYSSLSGIGPIKSLRFRLPKHAGRNSQGRITVRHQGGGVKQLYRKVDFKQVKYGVKGKVEALEYDPYRTAFIARVLYADGDRRYVLAHHNAKINDVILASENAPIEPGMRTQLRRLPVGTFVFNIELLPGQGGSIVRSAGTSAQVLAHEGNYTHLKLPSGEVRKVLSVCFATIGQVSNIENNLVVIGKAGRSRHLGIRPTVRGKVMNPRDHPYGGGEGRTQRGLRRPKTKWGKITGGHRTRNKRRRSTKLIVKRRK